jgi:thiol-disulfide isomerase/thioredoxin
MCPSFLKIPNSRRAVLCAVFALFIAAPLVPHPAFARAQPDAAVRKDNPKLGRGDTPPAIVLGITRRGEEVTVEQFPGIVRVVTFWASWCAPCRQEIVMLNKLQEVAKDSLRVVTVNIEDRQTFKEVTRQFYESKVTMANDPSKRAHNAYGVNGIPHMVIIGKDGKIASVKRGYSEEALPGLLREIEGEMGKG